MSTPDKTKTVSLPTLELDRRGFLKALGISGVATLAACERLQPRHAMPYLIAPEEITPGVPVRYASTCTGCRAACGLMVTVRDGRPTKLEGHRDHPNSRGGLCALGQAEIRGLYDAGRLTEPQVNGSSSSWSQVDDAVRRALSAVSTSGQTVHVLASPIASVTARQDILQFLKPYQGHLFEFDPNPVSRASSSPAYTALAGSPTQATLLVEQTDLLVVFGGDPLGTGASPVACTAAYTARRANHKARGPMRHVQVEGSLSLTGANADERWLATADERTVSVLWLLRELATRVSATDVLAAIASLDLPSEAPLAGRMAGVANELYKKRGRSLVLSGSNDLVEQVAVATCNRLLGNEGKTLKLRRSVKVHADLDALRDELTAGNVAVLVLLDIDPVDQFSDGEDWKKWLDTVPVSVAITDRPTATAASSKMVAAAHHGLECWYDFAPTETTRTLAQPTIRPFYKTRHPIENFLVWGGESGSDYREHLRAVWKDEVFPRARGAVSFEAFWHTSVTTGLAVGLAETPTNNEPPVSPPTEIDSLLRAPGRWRSGLRVELIAQVGVRDGSRSFNPWLRELPDPLTRVSWTPAAQIAPERAKKLGVVDSDVVRIQVGTRSVAMAVRVTPGQHPDVISVPVGYGRLDGDGGMALRNGYRLGDGGVATVRPAGSREPLPISQVHDRTEGRAHIHQVRKYDEQVPKPHHMELNSLWGEHDKPSPQWHMSINLDSCTGCSSCVIACQAENNVPVVGPEEVENNRILHWLRIDRYFVGEGAEPDVLFEPMMCAQCDNAPCETVCPAAATAHSQEGLNQQVYNRCVGTRYCANNCPYKVRRFNWFEYDRGEPVERMVLNPDVVVRSRGVMEKCSFCVQRIQLARIEARNRGDKNVPEVRTACQQSCPANAIRFGDRTDEMSDVARDRKEPRAFQVLAELGIEPSITYLARVRSRQS